VRKCGNPSPDPFPLRITEAPLHLVPNPCADRGDTSSNPENGWSFVVKLENVGMRLLRLVGSEMQSGEKGPTVTVRLL